MKSLVFNFCGSFQYKQNIELLLVSLLKTQSAVSKQKPGRKVLILMTLIEFKNICFSHINPIMKFFCLQISKKEANFLWQILGRQKDRFKFCCVLRLLSITSNYAFFALAIFWTFYVFLRLGRASSF